MPNFAFDALVPNHEVISTTLGAAANEGITDADVGKAVRMGTAQNYQLCAGTEEIEGFITSVEPITYNGGFAFGGVAREGRFYAQVGANQGVTPMAVGDLVVADAQAAAGTAGSAQVRTGTPTHNFWRCIRIVTGTGVAGDTVLVERI